MKAFKLTDLEREVTVSLLENALNGWTGHVQRQRAAQRVINKLQLDFKHEADCPCFGDSVEHSEDCKNCECENRKRVRP